MPSSNTDAFAVELQRALDLLVEVGGRVAAPDATSQAIDAFIEEMEQPVVTIKTDTDPSNPRDDDNAGVMFCQHRRYNLGDTDAEDAFVEEEGREVDGRWMNTDQIDHALACLEEIQQDFVSLRDAAEDESEFADLDALRAFGTWDNAAIQAVIEDLEDESEITERRVLRSNVAIALPLSLYDHSGITIYHGSPRQPWDSGIVGVHYMTRDVLDREFGGDEAKARACMEAELHTYDQYLRGNVWGFEIEDRAGRPIDSCWGFIGDELEETGMLEHADAKLVKAFHEAWDRRFA